MLMRNFDLKNGLCNGTRLMILDIQKHVIQVKIVSEKNFGHIFFLPRISFIPQETE